jgi:hypothetical protein
MLPRDNALQRVQDARVFNPLTYHGAMLMLLRLAVAGIAARAGARRLSAWVVPHEPPTPVMRRKFSSPWPPIGGWPPGEGPQ